MKGFARKNQLIITGLAIMIAVAGYLHFTSEEGEELSDAGADVKEENEWVEDAHAELLTDDEDSVQIMADDVDEDGDEFADISAEEIGEDEDGEKIVAENEKTETEEDTGKESVEEKENETGTAKAGTDGEKAGIKETGTDGEQAGTEKTGTEKEADADGEEAAQAGSSIGEAVLVNNTITGDYFSSARLSREQARAKNEETLMEIVNNAKMEETQKQEAVDNLIRLTEISEMETAAETLLGAKGFENAIVTITEDSADVVVDAEGLTKQQIVQIQDIVKRKTKIAAENIVITPVAVEE